MLLQGPGRKQPVLGRYHLDFRPFKINMGHWMGRGKIMWWSGAGVAQKVKEGPGEELNVVVLA